jgi:hypothetical protein
VQQTVPLLEKQPTPHPLPATPKPGRNNLDREVKVLIEEVVQQEIRSYTSECAEQIAQRCARSKEEAIEEILRRAREKCSVSDAVRILLKAQGSKDNFHS